MEFLQNLLFVIITAAVPTITTFVCKFFQSLYEKYKAQIKNEKIVTVLGLVTDMMTSAVRTTTNTYVKQLKADNLFDKEAQKEAFKRTYDVVMKQLTQESSKIIEETYGDVNVYVTTKIEELVETLKE